MYAEREMKASPEIKQQLKALRAEIAAKKLVFGVGHTGKEADEKVTAATAEAKRAADTADKAAKHAADKAKAAAKVLADHLPHLPDPRKHLPHF